MEPAKQESDAAATPGCFALYSTGARNQLWLKAVRIGLWFQFRTRPRSVRSEKCQNMSLCTLIVTPGYRQIRQAILSHAKAVSLYSNNCRRFDWLTLYGRPDSLPDNPDSADIITRKYQIARERFLASSYDRFVAIEDDMVIPEDAFPRLDAMLNDGADIAYGLYVWRKSIAGAWSPTTAITDDGVTWLLKDRQQSIRYFTEQVVAETKGVGMGCIAIQRHVLEKLSFVRRGPACCDWYLAVDAQEHGFVQKTDFGLVCGHVSFKPTPRVIYPDVEDTNTLQRVELMDQRQLTVGSCESSTHQSS